MKEGRISMGKSFEELLELCKTKKLYFNIGFHPQFKLSGKVWQYLDRHGKICIDNKGGPTKCKFFIGSTFIEDMLEYVRNYE